MKKNTHPHLTARVTLATLLILSSVALLAAIPLAGTAAENKNRKSFARPRTAPAAVPALPGGGPMPAAGAISAADTSAVTWVGTTISPGGNVNTEATCMDNSPVLGCETFTLTVNGTPADWAGKKIQVLLNWQSVSNEYDLYIHQGSNAGALVTSAVQGPALITQVAFIDPATAGTGVFTIHVVYDTTPASATDPYHGSVSVISSTGGGGGPPPAGLPVPAPQDNGPAIGYENFEAPGLLQQGTATSSGVATVEYLGRGAGEPSVGVNWNSLSSSAGGMVNFQSDLETLFISFDDSCSLTNPKATWVNRRAPTSVLIDSDPIGFTDRQTGRVFASQLTLLSPSAKGSYSDDDGQTWVVSQGSGIASGVDHQTIGGGPYHAPIPSLPTPYPHAVYYCSQDIGAALCSRSDDGGLTYGPSIPIYAVTDCGGLHGHVKVAPDGTVYVPNRACGSQSAVVVSTDNGTTWTVRPIQNGSVPTTGSSDDPSIAIDANGKIYCLFALNGTNAAVGMSSDQGQTWKNIYDVGGTFGLKNIAFPTAVGGDPGRASVAFYGTPTGVGDSNADTFTGVWHLYVAHTFDGGDHWTTSDLTPTLPMQRSGLLRGGGGPMTRNLLDFFDMTIDRDGRVVVGYVNGCSGGNCSQAPNNPDGSSAVVGNGYTVTASVARQSSGRRMLAANDPANPTSVPGMPFVTERRIGNVVRLAWNQSDTGNSPITGYQILRSVASGNEQPLATIGGDQTSYTDTTATDPSKTYYYKVVATNGVGPSCGNNEIAAPYVGDTCSGVIIHQNLPTHPESTGGTASPPPLPQYLIDYIAVGEPPSTTDLKFTMKVGNLTTLPPNSRWRIVWNSPASPVEQYYVGMTTDQNSTVSFEYGTLATLSEVVLGIPTENPLGAPDAGTNYNPDGTITFLVQKTTVGSPQPGDLLGAVNGRTFNTGDTPPETLERSNQLIDHTFVKGNTDNAYPPATYTVGGNTVCSAGSIEPISAVSRKTHGTAGTFDIDLPLTGRPGIECRTGGPSLNHTVVITFAAPVTSLAGAMVTPGQGGTGSVVGTPTVNNTQVTVNLTNVSNAQTLTINLLGVTAGVNSGDVAIPMSVLLGDTTDNGAVNSSDISETQSQSGQNMGLNNFREDVTVNGAINSSDIATVQSKSGTALP